ncbi:MAG TPA: MnmC family methyltransferase [Bdellovibrio sp.]|nr:MnmC family methyltransferase [Bdellovibrio sp.]
MKSWQEIGFEIEITGDGSPSLRLLTSVDPSKDRGESMHHSGGAASETDLIYGEPIREIFGKISKPHFLVVGLGLGYIELVIAREALRAGVGAGTSSGVEVGLITSYESVPELRESFFGWLHGEALGAEIQQIYDLVLEHVLKGAESTAVPTLASASSPAPRSTSSAPDLSPSSVKSFLRQHFSKIEDIRGALHSEVTLESKYHCILYDAFSSKTSPFLWEEDFLNRLLASGTSEQSVLSTYACKGTLKRALKNQGFEVFAREGFKGKRNSTLAKKNLK